MIRLLFIICIFISTEMFAKTDDLARLMAGNKRFMEGNLKHPNRTEERRQETATGQEPFAVVISCSDSRISPEIVFDEGIGDLFVVRLAGNVIGPLAKESIEFAVHHLHASLILVLGHENCGAVNAVLQKQDQDIPEIAALIAPSIKNLSSKDGLTKAIKANATRMKNELMQDKDFKALISKKKLQVFAGYYHLGSGEVEILNN